MTRHVSTRRSFIRTAGVAVSGPLAAAAAVAPVAASAGVDPSRARLDLLEDIGAIRALNQAYARHLNAGATTEIAALFADPSNAPLTPGVRSIAAHAFGEQDVIEVAADRATATGLVHCTVDAEIPIGPDCPLVDMARQQGGGVLRRTERGVFANTYVRRDGGWRIAGSTFRPA